MAAKKTAIPRKAKGAYHHGDLRNTLKQVALHLVRQKGARNLSLNEAARLAGVTVAAPYRHFTDKDALLADLACDGNALLLQELQQAVERVTGKKRRLVEAGMAYLQFSQAHADHFAVMFQAGLVKSLYPEAERSAAEVFGLLLGLVRMLEPSAERANQRALTVWAFIHGLASLASEGALALALPADDGLTSLRPMLEAFVSAMFG